MRDFTNWKSKTRIPITVTPITVSGTWSLFFISFYKRTHSHGEELWYIVIILANHLICTTVVKDRWLYFDIIDIGSPPHKHPKKLNRPHENSVQYVPQCVASKLNVLGEEGGRRRREKKEGEGGGRRRTRQRRRREGKERAPCWKGEQAFSCLFHWGIKEWRLDC